MQRLLNVVLILIWICISCAVFEDTNPVPHEVVDQGSFSGIHSRTEEVITSDSAWSLFWTQHNANRTEPRPRPDINFTTDVVVAILAGDRPTSGFQVSAVARSHSDGDVRVQYVVSDPTGPTLQVITQPFLIIKIRKPTGSVRIIREND